MKYNVLNVKNEVRAKPRGLVLFDSHRPAAPGTIGKECLSQWYPVGFKYGINTYPTAEHWMMAQKATLFSDVETRAKILAEPDVRAVKALGRVVSGFVSDTWNANCYEIVVSGNYMKFSEHPRLGAFLLSTGDDILAEASPSDLVWGIGCSADQPEAQDPRTWKGTNLLGFALMEVRDTLREIAAG